MFAWCYLMIAGGLVAVNGNLGDLANLGERISNSLKEKLAPLQGLEERLSKSLKPLDGLGQRISAQVETSLLPVRAMELKIRMLNGVGGRTVITFDKPYRSQLLADKYKTYVCQGTMSPNQPVCLGSLVEFQAKSKGDYCFSTYYSSVNDFFCIKSSASTQLSFSVFNNNRVCKAADNTGALGILESDYEKLCGRKYPWMVTYKYYANLKSPDRVEIPNKNPYVTCSESFQGVCTFRGNQDFNGGHSVSINSGNVVLNANK